MRLFESKKLNNNQMRALYGGARCTNDSKGNASDFVDNCGWTHYGNCDPNTEDGARVSADTGNILDAVSENQ
jgi:natural product precursor